MLGAPNQLVLRDRLAANGLLGPTMFVAAPSLNGNSAPDPDTAVKLVRAHKAAGYDLLKIHPGLSRDTYDAIALATRITPHIDTVELHRSYFGEGGPNPWGGVEAILTHLVSTILDVPSAHAPTMSSEALRTESWGVVEPRKAAEVISTTYLFCVLKGLNRAPQVLLRPTGGDEGKGEERQDGARRELHARLHVLGSPGFTIPRPRPPGSGCPERRQGSTHCGGG
jgi:hypothetical protein